MERDNTPKKSISGFGLALVLVGLVLLLAKLDPMGWHSTCKYFSWQVILIIVGLLLLRERDSVVMGIILISVGLFSLLPRIVFIPWILHRLFWPGVLIIIGLTIILSKRSHNNNNKQDS